MVVCITSINIERCCSILAKKDKLKVEFIGMNADNVTGSLTLIQDKGLTILLEAGLYQSNDIVGDYKVNNRNLNLNNKWY